MAKLTGSEYADKWKRRTRGATQDYTTGINRVTESPTQKAAAKKEKMRARLLDALDNGKWEAGLNRVDLATWKRMALEKGAGRIAAGVDMAEGKMAEFGEVLMAHIDKVKAQVDKLPDVTFEDSINRAVEFMRGMRDLKR